MYVKTMSLLKVLSKRKYIVNLSHRKFAERELFFRIKAIQFVSIFFS
jgi:hypothetical protein